MKNPLDEAIQHAIVGGYPRESDYLDTYCSHGMLLDPLFWKCLGRTQGWNIYICKQGEILPNSWLWYWHNFIDHIADGGTTEDFFRQLLTNK